MTRNHRGSLVAGHIFFQSLLVAVCTFAIISTRTSKIAQCDELVLKSWISMNSSIKICAARFLHTKCRDASPYPGASSVARFQIPDEKVEWSVEFAQYRPILYTAPSVLKHPVWADVDLLSDLKDDLANKSIPFNTLDGNVDRSSFEGTYTVRKLSSLVGIKPECDVAVPVNPFGRTGVCGRGLLGRWVSLFY